MNSIALTVGVVLAWKGEVWADDLRIEVAGPDVPTSDVYGKSQTATDDKGYWRLRKCPVALPSVFVRTQKLKNYAQFTMILTDDALH